MTKFKKILGSSIFLGSLTITGIVVPIVLTKTKEETKNNSGGIIISSGKASTNVINSSNKFLKNGETILGTNTSRFIFDNSKKELSVMQVINSKWRDMVKGGSKTWNDKEAKKLVIDTVFTSYLSFYNVWEKIKNNFSETPKLKIRLFLGYYKDNSKALSEDHTTTFFKDSSINNFWLSKYDYLNLELNVKNISSGRDFNDNIKKIYTKADETLKDNIKIKLSSTYDKDSVFISKIKLLHIA